MEVGFQAPVEADQVHWKDKKIVIKLLTSRSTDKVPREACNLLALIKIFHLTVPN